MYTNRSIVLYNETKFIVQIYDGYQNNIHIYVYTYIYNTDVYITIPKCIRTTKNQFAHIFLNVFKEFANISTSYKHLS